MYSVRIYARDPGTKSGRRQINSNTNGGDSIGSASKLVADTINGLSDADQEKVSRVLIEDQDAGTAGDLKLSFDPPKKKGAAETPAATDPAPSTDPQAGVDNAPGQGSPASGAAGGQGSGEPQGKTKSGKK